ncbi:uncharacterized protein LOC114858868 [Betta splendens]|uniref:Uncharacterized protein LOC114858868 n=1 Tax=Betta splendens TaxID=158456 RepID=A0A6P7MZE2_BETSP|nr:uncharacterized protein LOC114858868 [Betta splendens]
MRRRAVSAFTGRDVPILRYCKVSGSERSATRRRSDREQTVKCRKETCFSLGESMWCLERDHMATCVKIPQMQPSIRPVQTCPARMKEELVRQNALTVVHQRGEDATEDKELLGEYIFQFGKYKSKFFRWLLENDMSYTIYLIKNQRKEEAAGVFKAEGHNKDSLMSFLRYAPSFREKQDLLSFEAKKTVPLEGVPEDDQLVGFGSRGDQTWRQMWDSRNDGYTAFILKKSCVQGSRMHKLQQYLQNKQSCASVETPSPRPSQKAMQMDENTELEAAMLCISPPRQDSQNVVDAAAPPAFGRSCKEGSTYDTPNCQLWNNELLSQLWDNEVYRTKACL